MWTSVVRRRRRVDSSSVERNPTLALMSGDGMHPWSSPEDVPLGHLSSTTASDRRIRGDRPLVCPQTRTSAIQAPTIGLVGHGDDRPQLHGAGGIGGVSVQRGDSCLPARPPDTA